MSVYKYPAIFLGGYIGRQKVPNSELYNESENGSTKSDHSMQNRGKENNILKKQESLAIGGHWTTTGRFLQSDKPTH